MKTLSVPMPSSMYQELEKLSDEWGIGIHELIVFMIKYYLKYEVPNMEAGGI